MGFFRFRRSIKLFFGVRWNIGKKSSSLSIGGRGAHYTVGTSGSRTTIGIPGTGLSYTDIHRSHTQVTEHESYKGIPMPSQEWIRNNRINVTIHTPDRALGEAPIRPDQLEAIKAISHDFDLSQLSEFGEVQAESLLSQLKEQQKEASKTLLKKFYAYHGHAVPDDFVDHCYDDPKEHITVIYDRSDKGGCLSIIGYICLLWVFFHFLAVFLRFFL
jgi:hypothetical protein